MSCPQLLAPAKNANALVAVLVAVQVKHQVAVIKVKTHVPVVVCVRASKVAKTHCIVACLSAVS
ncbi:hypothetical protein D1872_308030 [compost metagenome]